MAVETLPSIEQISDLDYARLSANRCFYVSRPWLHSVERTRDGTVRYLCCRDAAGALLGVLPVYREIPGRYHLYEQFLLPSGQRFRPADWSPSLVLGTQAAYSTEFAIDPGLEPAERVQVLCTLLSAAARCDTGAQAPLAALYLNTRGQQQLAEVGIDAGQFFTTGGNCVIDVAQGSFADYAATLGSRRSRVVGRERRVFDSAGYEIITGPLSEFIDVSADLCTQLQQKYQDHSSTIETRRRYLSNLALTTDAHSHVISFWRGSQPAAVVVCFVWGDTVYVRQAGFDYSLTGRYFEYFNLCIYSPIELAIRLGLAKVDLGLSSYRAKLSRGARIEILRGYATSVENRSPNDEQGFRQWQAGLEALLQRADGRELDQEVLL
jgi:hypothetical protein